jgi:hypothetical protein
VARAAGFKMIRDVTPKDIAAIKKGYKDKVANVPLS